MNTPILFCQGIAEYRKKSKSEPDVLELSQSLGVTEEVAKQHLQTISNINEEEETEYEFFPLAINLKDIVRVEGYAWDDKNIFSTIILNDRTAYNVDVQFNDLVPLWCEVKFGTKDVISMVAAEPSEDSVED